jgi:hypothetical protein
VEDRDTSVEIVHGELSSYRGRDHRPKASNSLSLWIDQVDQVDQHNRGLVEIEVGLGCRVTGPRAEYFI